MLPEVDKAGFTPIEVPEAHRSPWAVLKIGAALAVVGAAVTVWATGYRPPMLRASTHPTFELAAVDRGDVDLFVVENGSIESSNNTTVRCEVEALVGQVGGSQGTSGKSGSSSSSSAQGSSGSSAQGSGGSQGSGTSASKSKAKKSSSSSSSKGGSSSTSKSGSSSASGSSSSTSKSGSSSASGSSSSASSASSSSAALSKPVLSSFSYTVTPYTPARGAAAGTTKTQDSSSSSKKTTGGSQGKGGSGKGGGRSSRGGRGGGSQEEEKPGSTRIVSIKPEGTHVKTGDIVAELDRATYEEEERTQKIRYLQARSYVDQAQSMFEVAEITLREYRDGIYPQDMQLIRQYIDSCRISKDRAAGNYKWSQDMEKMSYRTKSQVTADRLSLQQTEIALQEAQGMLERLEKYTGPKIIKSLEANVEAIRADLFTQEAAFKLEEQRLQRIQRNLEHCTVKAPGDGVVVYANQTDRWGRVTDVIDEGVTLREKQPIFNLPDPRHMRVRARINESKVALVQQGQPVLVLVDAYPDRPLKGVVGEVTPIAIPLMGSDVRIYYANVEIAEGFADLRPGLSAEIVIQVERRHDVPRVPVDAIRWVNGRAYVAVYEGPHDNAGAARPPWSWRRIEVGLSDSSFAEILKGVEPGARILADPANLPAPAPEKVAAR